MVIGQIISIFGNQILCFALSLYILDVTNSASLFATILVVSKIPMILLSMIGGIAADRLPRKSIMVVLDFFTSLCILCFTLSMNSFDIVFLTGCLMVILSIIQAFYQPSVSASIPSITAKDNLTSANSVTTGINAIASLAAPALGGMLYGFFGIDQILWLSMICFFLSAILELFLTIPFTKQKSSQRLLPMLINDFKEAMHFVTKRQPIMLQLAMTLIGLNFLVSALIAVGLPYIITIQLNLSSQLYGFMESALAIGMMIGAFMAMKLKDRITIRNCYIPMGIGILSMSLIGVAILTFDYPIHSYIIILFAVLFGMSAISIFNIVSQAYIQGRTPSELLGKVTSFIMTITQCALPLGQAMFGILFDHFSAYSAWIVFAATVLSLWITAYIKKTLLRIPREEV